jgi:hypothetical protein
MPCCCRICRLLILHCIRRCYRRRLVIVLQENAQRVRDGYIQYVQYLQRRPGEKTPPRSRGSSQFESKTAMGHANSLHHPCVKLQIHGILAHHLCMPIPSHHHESCIPQPARAGKGSSAHTTPAILSSANGLRACSTT